MKKIFFTSNTKHYNEVNGKKIAKEIDNTNGIVNQLKELLTGNKTMLFIASTPNAYEGNDHYAKLIFDGLNFSDIKFDNYLLLDNRTCEFASEYVEKADLIFLSGGNPYAESIFFKKINLKKLLENYQGVVMGQSAGSINLALDAYNSPEDGSATDEKTIYIEGLGLSNINIEPHFILDSTNFDENQLYQRQHILNESYKRPIYALCDGSHILETDENTVIYGESYLIKDGIISILCKDKESFKID